GRRPEEPAGRRRGRPHRLRGDRRREVGKRFGRWRPGIVGRTLRVRAPPHAERAAYDPRPEKRADRPASRTLPTSEPAPVRSSGATLLPTWRIAKPPPCARQPIISSSLLR